MKPEEVPERAPGGDTTRQARSKERSLPITEKGELPMSLSKQLVEVMNKDETARAMLAAVDREARKKGWSEEKRRQYRQFVAALAAIGNEEAMRILFEDARKKAVAVSR